MLVLYHCLADQSDRIAKLATEQRLAGSAFVVPGVKRFERHDDAIVEREHAMVMFHIPDAKLDALGDAIAAETGNAPVQLMAMDTPEASDAYLRWMNDAVYD